MTLRKLLVSTLLSAMLGQSLAAEVLMYGARDLPDACAVAAILSAAGDEGADAPATRVRAIRVFEGPGGNMPRITHGHEAARAAGEVVARPAARYSAFGLPLTFDVASHRIDGDMAAQLDRVAEGLRRAPSDTRVIIEGHTDASGDAGFNRTLSLRRAGMVKAYLVQVHGIEPERLTALGLGESRPLAGADPYSAANRRVEFRAVRA